MFTKFKALNDGDLKYKWNDFQFENTALNEYLFPYKGIRFVYIVIE